MARVALAFDDPVPRHFAGRLLDYSTRGFRAAHTWARLEAGQEGSQAQYRFGPRPRHVESHCRRRRGNRVSGFIDFLGFHSFSRGSASGFVLEPLNFE